MATAIAECHPDVEEFRCPSRTTGWSSLQIPELLRVPVISRRYTETRKRTPARAVASIRVVPSSRPTTESMIMRSAADSATKNSCAACWQGTLVSRRVRTGIDSLRCEAARGPRTLGERHESDRLVGYSA
jgi:hypothetical protein